MSAIVPPHADDVVQWITVRVHANGMLSIQGTIGDRKVALSTLDHARDAITRQIPDAGIIVPARDVEVVPGVGARALGDLARHERGDP